MAASGLDPTAGTCDGSRPTAVGLLAPRRAPLRLEGSVLAPEARELRKGGVGAARETGGLGRAESRCLADGGADDGDSQNVGLELHEEIVFGRPAVDLEILRRTAAVL